MFATKQRIRKHERRTPPVDNFRDLLHHSGYQVFALEGAAKGSGLAPRQTKTDSKISAKKGCGQGAKNSRSNLHDRRI
jgi:hypothetical protein